MTTPIGDGELRRFVRDALVAVGLPADDADVVAQLMVEADLTGADGHGIFRLPQYVRRLRAGGINPRPRLRIARDSAATALLDGDNGMGHLVMREATRLAIAKARQAGIGWVGSFNSNHAGPAALYAAMAADAGLIGLYLAVGSANHLAPWGGTDLLLSTNPIAIAVRGERAGLVLLDMATTVAAYGKVKMAAQRGEALPAGWMIDHLGRPLTDPKRAAEGLLLPIGDYKGYGLSLMFGLLAGSLNGAAMGSRVVDFNRDDLSATNTGQAIAVIDPSHFIDVASFEQDVDRVVDEMKGSRRLPGVERIRVPGEGREQTRRTRLAQGVPIPAALRAELDGLAQMLSIAPLRRPNNGSRGGR